MFLVDAARKLSAEDYTLASADTEGSLDLPRVYELYRTGATISLRHLHESMPELAALCRAVEKVFSSHFQTNIYLSPPNAQGFATHFDSHDVFVLQVAGSKIWTLYDTLIELPLHAQGFEKDKHIPGPATRDLTIRAGDLFYCPRGLFHSARSTDEPSLHITLGLIGKTWADVLMEAVSAACLSSPAFRANLPAGFANPGFEPAEAKATFRTLVEQFARAAELEPVLERFAEDFVTSRRPDLSGALQEVERRATDRPRHQDRAAPSSHLQPARRGRGPGTSVRIDAPHLPGSRARAADFRAAGPALRRPRPAGPPRRCRQARARAAPHQGGAAGAHCRARPCAWPSAGIHGSHNLTPPIDHPA